MNGLLVERHDYAAFADALIELAQDANLRLEMGAAGREAFERYYTLPIHLERMRQVFLQVAGTLPAEVRAPATEALVAP